LEKKNKVLTSRGMQNMHFWFNKKIQFYPEFLSREDKFCITIPISPTDPTQPRAGNSEA